MKDLFNVFVIAGWVSYLAPVAAVILAVGVGALLWENSRYYHLYEKAEAGRKQALMEFHARSVSLTALRKENSRYYDLYEKAEAGRQEVLAVAQSRRVRLTALHRKMRRLRARRYDLMQSRNEKEARIDDLEATIRSLRYELLRTQAKLRAARADKASYRH